ncbi:hypothetical protein B0H21DRAFT_491945 [Amylocystis lapponica]|nr:hypothetical protein B0H21DRAFT_491945 [Amylocystis lapponica]
MPSPHSRRLVETISHASLDPPNTERGLPEILLSRRHTRAAVPKLVATTPFETLPRLLIPHPGRKLRPPLMHYGWAGDVPAMLLEYAYEHKLLPLLEYQLYGHDNEPDTFLSRLEAALDIAAKQGLSCPPTMKTAVSANADHCIVFSV